MHIPDGFLSAPVAAGTGVLAAAGVGTALARLRPEAEPALTPQMGMTAAYVFAAQMVNFPVAGGTSGHLLGAVLTAILLGPTAATVAMAAVFIIQAFFFLDGGHTALGANVLNMGLAGTLGGYAVYRSAAGPAPTRRRCLAAGALAAWVGVMLGASLTATELALSGAVPARVVFPAMLGIHAVIGFGEAAITVASLALVWRVRPDLITARAAPAGAVRRWGWGAFAGLAAVAALAPFASPFPDGLEAVAERLGFLGRAAAPLAPGPFPDYTVPGLESLWGPLAVCLGGAGLMLLAVTLLSQAARVRTAGVRPPRPDARLTLAILLAFALTVALVPIHHPGPLYVLLGLALVAAALARVSLLGILRRAWVLTPFLLLLLCAPLMGGAASWHPALPGDLPVGVSLLLRALASLVATATFVSITPEAEVLEALRALGVPGVLADTITGGLRYFRVTTAEAGRMLRARAARCAGAAPLRVSVQGAGGLVGTLFVRSCERSERIGAAMAARGFTGKHPARTPVPLQGRDWALGLAVALLLVGVWLWR